MVSCYKYNKNRFLWFSVSKTGSAPCARYNIYKQTVDAGTVVNLTMAPSVGFAISLKEI